MKNITITIDLKSICIGAAGVLCIVGLSNFNKPDAQKNDPADEVRRYQVVTDQRNTIILDTKTGKFLLDPSYTGHPRWQKGDFTTMHNDAAPKTD